MSPRPRLLPTIAALALMSLLLLGCLSLGEDPPGLSPRDGVDRWSLRRETMRSQAGCRYAYRVFEPDEAPRSAVMLGHGFLRDQDTLIGLASALAAAGHRAVTLDFCNMRPWNGHHRRNADDMLALAGREGLVGRTAYAGFSAGALAALLAGADDADALGVLTLDLVDQAGLGVAAARRLTVPLTGFAGPDSACNANGNGRDAFSVAEAGRKGRNTPSAAVTLERIPNASHCEFESPTNWLCEIACGDETPLPADPEQRRRSPNDALSDAREREQVIMSVVRVIDALAD